MFGGGVDDVVGCVVVEYMYGVCVQFLCIGGCFGWGQYFLCGFFVVGFVFGVVYIFYVLVYCVVYVYCLRFGYGYDVDFCIEVFGQFQVFEQFFFGQF